MSTSNIVDKMLMVKLNCSYDTGYRQSDQACGIVTNEVNCESSMLKTGVSIFNRYRISDFTRSLSNLRTYYQEHTLPWDTKSWRVIPASKFQDFKDEIETLIAECQDKYKEVFVDGYDELKESFDDKKGDLDVEFPTKDELEDSLNIEYDMGAAASSNDIRIQGIDQEARKQLSESMDKQYKEKINKGLGNIADRLTVAAQELGSRTSDENQKGKKYKRSLENLSELADTVESLNLTGDARIKQACQTIKEEICQWSPEAIKTTPMVRDSVNEATGSVIDRLSTINI